MTLRVIDAFAGIGGFSLAAHWLGGFTTVQFVEREPFCQRILSKHWPTVPIHDDICTFKPERGSADVICGGFPCQDISQAGKGAGLAGSRSGLFYELLRVVRLVEPRYVVLENVAAITHRGMDAVLGALAEAGYDAEWACIPAAAVGACHQRDRWWCVAYANGQRCNQGEHAGNATGSHGTQGAHWVANALAVVGDGAGVAEQSSQSQGGRGREGPGQGASQAGHEGQGAGNGAAGFAAYATGEQRNDLRVARSGEQAEPQSGDSDGKDAADPSSLRGQRRRATINVAGKAGTCEADRQEWQRHGYAADNRSADAGNTYGQRQQEQHPPALAARAEQPAWPDASQRLNPDWRSYVSEPVLRRGDDGLSGRVDRLKALGNAVVPQVAMVPLARVLELERQLNK